MPELWDHETASMNLISMKLLIKSLSIDRQHTCVLRIPAVPGSHKIKWRWHEGREKFIICFLFPNKKTTTLGKIRSLLGFLTEYYFYFNYIWLWDCNCSQYQSVRVLQLWKEESGNGAQHPSLYPREDGRKEEGPSAVGSGAKQGGEMEEEYRNMVCLRPRYTRL